MQDKIQRFKDLLLSTHREGIEQIIDVLAGLGFFEAPASTRFHLCHKGGLLEHSLNVYDVAIDLRELMIRRNKNIEDFLPVDSVIIAALLHDTCKADIYRPAEKIRKKALGIWTPASGYDVDYNNFPMGHGEKSVLVLMKHGLRLTDDEIAPIRWHMHAWDLPFQSYELINNLNTAKKKYPLLSLLQAADGLASNLIER